MEDNRKAFTIIELMSVLIIIGVLASLAIPSFVAVKARAKQEKMKNTLRLIARYEEVFFAENDYYAPGKSGVNSYDFEIFHDGRVLPEEVNLSELPFVFPDNRNYDYRIYWVNNGEEHYFYAYGTASTGRGNDIDGDAKMDQWQVSSYDIEPIALSNDLGGGASLGSGEGGEGGGEEGEIGGGEEGEGGGGEGEGEGEEEEKGKGKGKEKEKKGKEKEKKPKKK